MSYRQKVTKDGLGKLRQLLALIFRQNEHLWGVHRRLFGEIDIEAINGDWFD